MTDFTRCDACDKERPKDGILRFELKDGYPADLSLGYIRFYRACSIDCLITIAERIRQKDLAKG